MKIINEIRNAMGEGFNVYKSAATALEKRRRELSGNEYSDEYMVKWLNILRVMQENGISNNAANQLTQLIANFFGSDVQPLSLEEVEAIMKERGLESTNTE